MSESKHTPAVWLVATGEIYAGEETYTRHDERPPMCDAEPLYGPDLAAEVEQLRAALAAERRKVDEIRLALGRAWLVEWKAHGLGPQWWGFWGPPDKTGRWCSDANSAIRFARKEDAERMRLHVIAVADLTGHHDYERQITVTEHEWVAALAATEGGA